MLVWRKSSFSGSNGGTDCVEVALPPEAAALRDSKHPGPFLLVRRSAGAACWVRSSARSAGTEEDRGRGLAEEQPQ